MCGNASYLGDVGGGPGKSSLFFLTASDSPESVYPEMGKRCWKKHPTFWVSGALLTTLEKPSARIIHTPGRTYHRSRSPRFIASSLWDNVGKLVWAQEN